jgi:hypothetical protein
MVLDDLADVEYTTDAGINMVLGVVNPGRWAPMDIPPAPIWYGTQERYDLLPLHKPDWLYIITD